jgi:hypothetical protein
MAERPRALQLDPADNVAVAVVPLEPGDSVLDVRLRESIRFGHKLALRDIPAGEPILKYHEVIGRASEDIAAGTHVHVHNVVSARLPGPQDAA